MKNLNNEIGIRISRARKNKKLTQEKLAELLDVSVKHISAVERGKSSLSLEKLISICNILDVSLDYLVNGNSFGLSDAPFPKSAIEILCSEDTTEKDLFLEYIRLYEKIRKK